MHNVLKMDVIKSAKPSWLMAVNHGAFPTAEYILIAICIVLVNREILTMHIVLLLLFVRVRSWRKCTCWVLFTFPVMQCCDDLVSVMTVLCMLSHGSMEVFCMKKRT